MKKLQNSFTTPEQSKRLLELGVPADSANLCYRFYTNLYGDTVMWDTPSVIAENQHIEWSHKLTSGDTAYIPCWSVGRLIEIMALCYKFEFPDSGSVKLYATDIKKRIVVDVLISDIERFINKIDFSKLED